MKTNAECAEIVLKWATDNAIGANYKRIKADCDDKARRFAEKMWKEQNPDDGVGGFGSNPYQEKSYHQTELKKIVDDNETARSVLEFVQHQICKGFYK